MELGTQSESGAPTERPSRAARISAWRPATKCTTPAPPPSPPGLWHPGLPAGNWIWPVCPPSSRSRRDLPDQTFGPFSHLLSRWVPRQRNSSIWCSAEVSSYQHPLSSLPPPPHVRASDSSGVSPPEAEGLPGRPHCAVELPPHYKLFLVWALRLLGTWAFGRGAPTEKHGRGAALPLGEVLKAEGASRVRGLCPLL